MAVTAVRVTRADLSEVVVELEGTLLPIVTAVALSPWWLRQLAAAPAVIAVTFAVVEP